MAKIVELEQDGGYQFTICGKKRSMSGTIAFLCGDNLALQELGGFKVGPCARLRCRECMGTVQDIKSMVCALSFGHFGLLSSNK